VCGGALEEHHVEVRQVRNRRHPADYNWKYTGPLPGGRRKKKRKPDGWTTLRRPIWVCTTCSVRVVLHRDRSRGRRLGPARGRARSA
jgi:hypothetical protein